MSERPDGQSQQTAQSAKPRITVGPSPLAPPLDHLVRVGRRRWLLQAGLSGLAGLSVPLLLRSRADAAEQGRPKSPTANGDWPAKRSLPANSGLWPRW